MLSHLRTVVVMAALFALSPPTYALKFRVIENDGFGQRVLLIHDCAALTDNTDCTPATDQFSSGDEIRLKSAWVGQFEEVWLLSGGGSLFAGIAIGNELRTKSTSVRVPGPARLLRAGLHLDSERNYHCVSSCTVAFMGGQFRFIDPDATYQVHAASSVSWSELGDERVRKDILRTVGLIKSGGLRAAANDRTDSDCRLASDLFALFQETLSLPVQDRSTPTERRRRDQILNQWARGCLARGYAYNESQLARDEKIYEMEGIAALQDILMRIERSGMDQAIGAIQSILPQLGRRSEAALAMLAAMYETSSIKQTNVIPRETLVKMGYITELVK